MGVFFLLFYGYDIRLSMTFPELSLESKQLKIASREATSETLKMPRTINRFLFSELF
jgi:hypothetical protein